MILNCPHCGIAQAEGDGICINCGQTLRPAPPADPAPPAEADTAVQGVALGAAAPGSSHDVQARRSSWKPPALVAAALLLALAASALFVSQRRPALHAAPTALTSGPAQPPPDANPQLSTPAAAAAPPAPTPAAPREGVRAKAPVGPATSAAPLTITLASTREGRRVKVGEGVTLTAFISSAHGRSATLALFSRRGREPRTMVSFAQGSLCSTTWTPPAPGRYEFTATALDDHQRAASRRIAITVDPPAPLSAARVAAREEALPVTPRVPAAPPLPRRRRASLPPPRVVPTPKAAVRVRPPAPATSYHVAAARFPFSRSAVVLADALNRRGYHAVSERMSDPHGKAVYAVVTGTYRRPKEARAAALALQRSGYPAYVFGGR